MGRIRLAVLLSGGGTTLENIFERIADGSLPAEVACVVSSKSDAFGLERARRRGVVAEVVASAQFRGPGGTDWAAMSAAINRVVLPLRPDLVCLAGFMCKYVIPPELRQRVMNIHPALLPAFCGRGMYGHRVHEAVVAAGVRVSGCTVHFADNEYDAGPIILQRACPVLCTDTADDVARRVFAEECAAYPEAIRLFAEGRLEVRGRTVHVKGDRG